ncbi:hypothetical protein KIPB_011494, partial [Kipferlia bialata]
VQTDADTLLSVCQTTASVVENAAAEAVRLRNQVTTDTAECSAALSLLRHRAEEDTQRLDTMIAKGQAELVTRSEATGEEITDIRTALLRAQEEVSLLEWQLREHTDTEGTANTELNDISVSLK